ncbi:MAG: leucine-rich repeat domain-containing protein [Candidatus Peribacteria bacterium]|jgi:hypothetical protein|nr:leucine-rich repeat domain-containing protein [Candidatus Peribacteria bacterium]
MHHFFTTISKVAGIVGILSLSVSFAATPPLLPHSAETAMKWTRTVPAQTSKTITFTTNNTDTPLLVDCGGGTLVCHTVNSFSCVYATGGTYEVILANPEALQTIQGLSTANIIAFQGGNARNLQALELNTNQLTSIDETMFSGLVQLSELNVSRNQIRTIAPNAFIHQTKLGNLHLEANSLTTITKEHLQGMPNLTYLGLDRNNLFSLDADLFDYQTSQSFGVDLWGNCLDTSTTFTTSRVNSSRKYNQNVCAIISYSPSSPTTGNVVGTVVLTGGSEEKREQIDVSNLLTHTRTGNGTWTFDLSAIP